MTELTDKIILRKYKIIEKIAKGGYSSVYLGIDIQNGTNVAIKIGAENIENSNKYLEKENSYLKILNYAGIPKFIDSGEYEQKKILVESLLGKSIQDIFIEKNRQLCIKDVCMIGIQLLNILEYIHNKNILHLDIKPSNILIGKSDKSVVYLVDFGFSKNLKNLETGEHIKLESVKEMNGTLLFTSVSNHKLMTQSRKDDLESLAYTLIYLIKGTLPWNRLSKDLTTQERNNITLNMKQTISEENLCTDLPKGFIEFIKYTKKLSFKEKPNYSFLKNILNQILINQKLINDGLFSWVKYDSLCSSSYYIDENIINKEPLNDLKNSFIKGDNYNNNVKLDKKFVFTNLKINCYNSSPYYYLKVPYLRTYADNND